MRILASNNILKMRGKTRRLSAFTLIEVLVYLASVSMFALLIFDFLYEIQKKAILWEKDCFSRVQIELVTDILRRDLISASMNLEDWDLSSNVFKKRTLDKRGNCIVKDIYWNIRKGRLFRREGVYDYRLKKWKEKVDSVTAYNVNSLKIDIKLDKLSKIVVGALFKVKGPKSKDRVELEYVSLRNRILKTQGNSEK